jgi:uncharacterized membrane protein
MWHKLGWGLVVWVVMVMPVSAQDVTMEAKVDWIVEEGMIEFGGKQQPFQVVSLEIVNGAEAGKKITYEYGKLPMAYVDKFKVGERVILGKSDPADDTSYYLVDRVRRQSLYGLAGLFVITVIMVAGGRALRSILALISSFVVIFYVVLPQLLAGMSPLVVSLLGAIIIIPITFYLSHGFETKTHVAAMATFLALAVTAGLSHLFVEAAHLSGYASEEATFLQHDMAFINVKALLLAGMIIGVLGILDDVTVSQASVVEELLKANPKLSVRLLYKQAMNVGTDHISSMINTLVLVYVGAAMPLLLLFMNSPKPITEIINYEMVAEEIVRTLTGSIGLVLAVPITTILAALRFKRLQLN